VDKDPKKKTVSVNFSCALFSLMDFLTLEAGWIGCHKLPERNYYSVLSKECRSRDDLAMQILVWLHMVTFRAVQFGAVQFGTPYTNLIRHHVFKCQI